MEIDYHPAVMLDLDEAVDWYNTIRPELGFQFQTAYLDAISQILANPDLWPPKEDTIRRYRTDHFPYGIFYVVRKSGVFILAISHLRRDSRHWRSRLKH